MPDWYTGGSVPATGSPGASAPMRAEFAAMGGNFAKMPVLAGNAGYMVRVNSTGTALESAAALGSAAVASNAEVTAGTSNTKAVTPSSLKNGQAVVYSALGVTTATNGRQIIDVLSEAEYEAIDPKDADTIYIIE